MYLFFLLLIFGGILNSASARQPHIILILADDLGFHDTSFRGSDLIPTPNIDALAFAGRILNRHYVLPTCTPSRSALLTGMHPILLGTQGQPMKAGQRGGVPLSYKLFPQKLQDAGYKTHMTGKWHIGYQSLNFLPTRRGFDSFLGYFNGFIDYYRLDQNQTTADERVFRGYDMHEGSQPRRDLLGQYATDIFTQRAVDVIRNHDVRSPLFLFLSHLAAHTGTEEGDGLQTPPGDDPDELFSYLKKKERRRYAGIVKCLDESVGEVVQALAEQNMLKDSIILFLADNGAPSVSTDMQANFGSNWPLRGVKFTLYEGGVRGTAIFWGADFPGQVIDEQVYHITDWEDILLLFAGVEPKATKATYLVETLASLNNTGTFSRNLLLNLDEKANSEGILLDSKWKIVKQNLKQYANYDRHYQVQPNGDDVPEVTAELVRNSKVGIAFQGLGVFPDDAVISSLRQQAKVQCEPVEVRPMGHVQPSTDFVCKNYCVFDIIEDPCELRPLEEPGTLARGQELLDSFRKILIPQNMNPVDDQSNPKFFGGVWTPWLDGPEGYTWAGSDTVLGSMLLASCFLLFLVPAIIAKIS